GGGAELQPAELLCEAGTIYQHHLRDETRAVDAFDRALAVDPGSRRALQALAALHRLRGRNDELLSALRRLAAHEADPAARVPVHLEAARVAEAGGHLDEAVIHLREALRLDVRAALEPFL